MKLIKEDDSSETQTFRTIIVDDNFAVFGPYKVENSKAQNSSEINSLKQEVKKLGYGFNELLIMWSEYDKDTDKNNSFDEMFLFVHDITKSQAIKLSQQYKQSSIIVKDESGCKEICIASILL